MAEILLGNIKGPKGDPLTFDDLTAAQKAELKGAKGDEGASFKELVPVGTSLLEKTYAEWREFHRLQGVGLGFTATQASASKLNIGDIGVVYGDVTDRADSNAVVFLLLESRSQTTSTYPDYAVSGRVLMSFISGETGDKGEPGEPGAAGKDGINGAAGKDGINGATFIPSVDADGNLSWSNDGDLDNPATVNLKGPKGDPGAVQTVNGVAPDASGNVEIEVSSGGGGSGDGIPKTGNRGELAGYETAYMSVIDLETEVVPDLRVNENSPDVVTALGSNIIVENGSSHGLMDWMLQLVFFENVTELPTTPCKSWTKVVTINSECTVTLGSLWRWKDKVVPSIENGLLLLYWGGDYGTACFIDTAEAFYEILEQKAEELM